MENEEKSTAIYKVDPATRGIAFSCVGVWEDFVQLGKIYTIDQLEMIFREHILSTSDKQTQKISIDAEGKLPEDYQVGEKISSFDFLGYIPEANTYEWFSNFLIQGADGKFLGNIRNIHEQKTKQLENEYRASHDLLTGIYNRKTFEEKFKILQKQYGGGCLAILDVDNFKRINDEYGHIYGDTVLEEISKKMKEILPEGAICGRFGGDEFLVFYPGLTERKIAEREAESLTEQLASLCLGENSISISTGFAFSPEWGVDFVGLINHADTALRFSKKTGKNRFTFNSLSIERLMAEEENVEESGRTQKMQMDILKPSTKRKIWGATAVISTVVLIGTALVGLLYEQSFRDVMMKESYVYLHEISKQQSESLNAVLTGYQDGVRGLTEMIVQERWEDKETLVRWVNSMCRSQGFSGAFLVDEEGIMYDPGGERREQEPQNFFSDMQDKQEIQITGIRQINGIDYMALGCPMNAITETGIRYTGVVVVLNGDDFRKRLSLSAFDGASHSMIITRDGDTILKEPDSSDRENLIEILGNADFQNGDTLEKVRKSLQNGEKAQIHYRMGGEDRIAAIIPVGIEDWFLATTLNTNFVYEKSNAFSQLARVSSLVIGLVFLLLLFICFVIWAEGRKRLIRAAYVDPVTGGNNLNKFTQEVPHCMAASDYQNAVLYANVVGFKIYNDRFGRDGADQILKRINTVIEKELGRGECIGRLMADHFGILIKAESQQEINARIEGWNYAISCIGTKENEPYTLELNYGIYFIDDPKLEVQQMLDRANLARQSLTENHHELKNYALYDKALKDRLLFEQELSNYMHKALENGEFKMYLQGKYGLEEDGFVGAEALVRWKHPIRGMIMPGDFIPLFEKNGFIEKLDLYMFAEACKWIQGMIDLGMSPIPISVNLSIAHFQTPNFLDGFCAEWRKYQFPASLLELEFTESMMYGKIEEFQNIIRSIHHIGFRCSMDDFGSGYSSLNELGSLELDTIKLDRQFFMDSIENAQRQTTVCYAIQLIKALNMKSVAEGVEESDQVELLKSYGCDMVQGYVFAKPMAADEFLDVLRASAPVF